MDHILKHDISHKSFIENLCEPCESRVKQSNRVFVLLTQEPQVRVLALTIQSFWQLKYLAECSTALEPPKCF